MGKAQISSAMEIITMGIIKMENLMVRVYILGKMEVNMMENFSMDLNMVKVFGKRTKMILLVTDMKVIIKTIGSMAMVNFTGSPEISIKATI